MKRRSFLGALCMLWGAGLSIAYGQKHPPLVGWIAFGDERAVEGFIAAFREGMQALGYEDGRNVRIEVALARFSRERADRLVADLIAKRPAVIVSNGYPLTAAAALTKTIPIVAGSSSDLVDLGLAKSLAHPGGNVTGMQFLALELVGKRIEVLKEILPNLKRAAVIADPSHAGVNAERDASAAAAARLGIRVSFHPLKEEGDLEPSLAAALASQPEALVVFPDAVTNPNRERIGAFALRHKLPTVAGWGHHADAGQLVAYGPNLRASWRRIPYFVDRVLKGADPATLPIELPTSFELVVNLKTAKTLGLAIPQQLLLRAERVIE